MFVVPSKLEFEPLEQESATSTMEVVKKSWQPLEWNVDGVYFLTRDDELKTEADSVFGQKESGKKGGVFVVQRKILLGSLPSSGNPWPPISSDLIDYCKATVEVDHTKEDNGADVKITSAELIRSPLSRLIPPKKLSAHPVFEFDTQHSIWKPISVVDLARKIPPQAAKIKATTFNTLCDEFCTESIFSEQRWVSFFLLPCCRSQISCLFIHRWPLVSKVLMQEDADVIALQEATPELFRFLLSESWVRRSYFVSESGRDSRLFCMGGSFSAEKQGGVVAVFQWLAAVSTRLESLF